MTRRFLLFLACWLTAVSVNGQKQFPKREMRAVWIATVDNIDWPSKPGLSVEEQKSELLRQLDLHKSNGMNAVVFQVRPATDAFYPSSLDPWSQWLTGIQGQAPDPFYDPLKFAIEECHKRGMELHAWLNPYRAVFLYKEAQTAPDHISNRHPEWFLSYGKHKYFNPGLQQTRDYVSRVVADLVRRYDVDAIHFDDYFYPYKIRGEEFPDRKTFTRFPRGFKQEEFEDWRRDNVDLVIKQVHDSIKSVKPFVKFGISPFGVWRNKKTDPAGSATQAGQTNYDDLYADVLKWCKKDWIDYVTPQIYWHIGKKVANYRVLLKWWNKNSFGKNLYIGQGVYRLKENSKTKAWRNPKQISRQVRMNRCASNVDGSMFFSSKSFQQNPMGISERFQTKIYPYPALVPENGGIQAVLPSIPENLSFDGDSKKLSWEPAEDARFYVVYRFDKHQKVKTGKARNIVGVTGEPSLVLDSKPSGKYKYVVTALSRTNYESKPSPVFVPKSVR